MIIERIKYFERYFARFRKKMRDFILQISTVYNKNNSMPIISLKRGYTCIHMRYSLVNPYISLASHFWDIGKQCRPRSDAAERGVWSGYSLFANVNIDSKYNKKWKSTPDNANIGNGIVQLIMVDGSTRQMWINEAFMSLPFESNEDSCPLFKLSHGASVVLCQVCCNFFFSLCSDNFGNTTFKIRYFSGTFSCYILWLQLHVFTNA